MGSVLIGVDAGTSYIKAVAFSRAGEELAVGSEKSPVHSPRVGWKEQRMGVVWERTASAIRSVVDELDSAADVVGIGVAGHGGGCWLLDESGTPVRDPIVWNDARAAEIVDRWRENGVYESIFQTCGHGVQPGLPLPIFRWLKDNEPEHLQRADTVFSCKDWIKYRLTGRRTTDPSDASLGYIRPETGELATEILDKLGLSEVADLVPEIVPGDQIVGEVTDDAARETGLPAGTPVVSGVMDVVASAFGSGAVSPGDSSSIVGTTLQNQTVVERPVIDSTAVGYTLSVGIDGMGLRALGAMTGTPNIDWASDRFAEGATFEDIEAQIADIPIGCDGVLYHPYLNSSGEKAPFVDPAARAQFTGLSSEVTNPHLLRAVYEGVALAMRDCYEHLPYESDDLFLSGGGARSSFWCQLFSDCLGTEIKTSEGSEMGAQGVALLAGIATGAYRNLGEASTETLTIDRSYRPVAENTAKYDLLYDQYLYSRKQLSEVWQRARETTQRIRQL